MSKTKIIFSIFLVLILILIGVFFSTSNNTPIEYNIIKSTDEKIEISLPSNISYKLLSSNNENYSLNLYSEEDEMYIYTTTISKARELDLLNIIKDDKASYLSDKENIINDTEIVESNINGYTGYEYSLEYYDSEYKDNFYANIIWIETQENVYILNFEVVTKNTEKIKPIFDSIKNSIKFN